MQVHHNIQNLPVFNKAVITIGTFDGVHTGHQQIITTLKDTAAKVGGQSIIITFHPHPRTVIAASGNEIKLINTLSERVELIAKTGIDHLVVVPFTDDFAHQTAEAYIGEFLVKKFSPHTIIIGYDHRFGRERQGDYKLMEDKAIVYNYQLLEIPVHLLNEAKVSSSTIRKAIVHGTIEEANQLLGYPFFFDGLVVHGDKIGRTLGYPTANLTSTSEEKIPLGDGIYAVRITIGNETYKGMMSIGFRPTVNGKKRVTEVNIFDFEQNIYDLVVRVHVIKHLRKEVKFNGLEALKEQLHKDKEDSLAVL